MKVLFKLAIFAALLLAAMPVSSAISNAEHPGCEAANLLLIETETEAVL